MNYLGVYHADLRSKMLGICDAPHISKGQMTLSGFETASDAGTIALVHGRMRNRSNLAKILGCAPYTSQAELVLKAYKTWGLDYVQQLQGPVMSCIADVEADCMYIVRDRMGENSIFYACKGGGAVFADHPDMILKSTMVEPQIDAEGLCEIFGLGPARTPGKTPLKGLHSLKAGCMLICKPDRIEEKQYYRMQLKPHAENEKTTVEHVRHLLEMSVDDIVPLHPGCMLSGGIDSTALTALLSTRIGRLDSFSVDYRDNEKDFVSNSFRPEMDAPYIRLAAKLYGTRHHTVLLEQDALAESLGKAVRARGFPGMGDIDSSLLLFAREIVRVTPSVVSGECGDEVFGGYPWFAGEPSLPEKNFPWSGSIELREGILRSDIREKLKLKNYVQETMQTALDSYDVTDIEDITDQSLFKLQRLCFDFFMPNLQERAVRMCEIHGLQVLTPLCDERVVEYVYNVPWKMKRMGGMEKGLYREAVRDLLPDKLLMRKKSPYPKTCSAAYSSIVRGKMRALRADKEAPIWKIVDMDSIEKLSASALDPAQTPWFGQLMAGTQMLAYLLQLNNWLCERDIAIEI